MLSTLFLANISYINVSISFQATIVGQSGAILLHPSFITTISSSDGVQQGDSLGPLLFCLVLHKHVEKIESQNFSTCIQLR